MQPTHFSALERLAFLEQLAQAPATHRVVDSTTAAVLYTGPLASCMLVFEEALRSFIAGAPLGVPELHPIGPSDGPDATQTAASEAAGSRDSGPQGS
jgi:hypothetical protein